MNIKRLNKLFNFKTNNINDYFKYFKKNKIKIKFIGLRYGYINVIKVYDRTPILCRENRGENNLY